MMQRIVEDLHESVGETLHVDGCTFSNENYGYFITRGHHALGEEGAADIDIEVIDSKGFMDASIGGA